MKYPVWWIGWVIWLVAAAAWAGGDVRGVVRDLTPDDGVASLAALERRLSDCVAAAGGAALEQDDELLRRLLRVSGLDRPVAGAVVTLRPAAGDPRHTITDAQGQFQFSDVPAGTTALSATFRRHGFCFRSRVSLDVQHGQWESDWVELEFHPAPATLAGRVTDAAGHPLAGVRVQARPITRAELEGLEAHAELLPVAALTGPDGCYRLPGLQPGNAWFGPARYELRVEAPGFVPSQRQLPVSTARISAAAERLWEIFQRVTQKQGDEQDMDMMKRLPVCRGDVTVSPAVALGRPGLIAGCVTDPQQRGLPACSVVLQPRRRGDVIYPASAPTDDRGAFTFTGVPAGDYDLAIYQDCRGVRCAEPVTVAEGGRVDGLHLELDLQPLGRLAATVLAPEDGRAVTNFTVVVRQVRNPHEYMSSSGDIAMNATGPGTFAVTNLSPGEAELEVTSPGRAPERVLAAIPPGGATNLCVRLAAAGVAAVRLVRDGEGLTPAENLQAFSEATGQIVWGRGGPRDGWYEIEGLKAGRHLVRAHIFERSGINRWVRYATASVDIVPGQTNRVTVDISGSCALALDLDIPCDRRAQVEVLSPDASLNRDRDLVANLWNGRPGRVCIEHLPPGPHRVRVRLVNPACKREKADEQPTQEQVVILSTGQPTVTPIRFAP